MGNKSCSAPFRGLLHKKPPALFCYAEQTFFVYVYIIDITFRTFVLWLVQGEVVKSVDVTNLSEPLEYPLNDFENGEIHVRLQINGVEDTVSEIYVK